MLVSAGALDEEARSTLLTDSRELELRAALRMLRERVVDATGLVEDGSALNAQGSVAGLVLDGRGLRDPDGWAPLPGGAPDLISAATDAAARALGWTSPEGLARFLAELGEDDARDLVVAVRLPPPPAYHTADMRLRAEIDRGDVWRARARRFQRPERHPSLILYVQTASGELPLVRWPTTIGGWQRERLATGVVVLRYKESHPGAFVWRDLLAAPVWFPPPTTPDREISEAALGPGYRSAYGLVALLHHREVIRRGAVTHEDTAVRTHGSVSYGSIRVGGGGHSHGCHRLFNHLALRLGGFLLRHRAHDVLGATSEHYERRIVRDGRRLRLVRESRGYLYRLAEPVPVVVLPGRVH
jgi:hypothetical protein